MDTSRLFNIHIGQIRTGKNNDILKATLGSCVGIAFIWREKKIAALAHCLLPEAAKVSFTISARTVTEAIPSLIALLKIRPDDRKQIEAIVVGGGNMTGDKEQSSLLIGQANVNAAIKLLSENHIKIAHQDTGGEEGRNITLNCADFSYTIRAIPRIIT